MKVLLTEDVKKLGKKGEIVDVSDGYAKNFILPKKLGIEATKAVLNEWQIKKGSEENRKRKEEEQAKAQAAELSGKEVVIRTKTGEGGRLFGSITSKDVADVIEKLPEHPKAVLLFTVCLHHFLGCDLERVYQELEERFPDIAFIRCYMDPIMQKTGLTPDQKLRKAMYDPLPQREADSKTVALLGSDFALDKSSDLVQLLQKNEYEFKELPKCQSWEEYLELSKASLFVSCYPPGRYGAQELADRLGRKHLYLPACFGYEEIGSHLNALADALGLPEQDFQEEIESCEKALEQAKQEIGDMPIALDYMFHPRPLGLARLLISHGFAVKTVYLDAISLEEKEDFLWLQEHAPQLELAATIHVKMRVLPRGGEQEVLAIGQKAAWFCRSSHFVNMVQGGGLYGFDGIRKLAELMIEAFREEKDTESLVVQKGWGCDCCL